MNSTECDNCWYYDYDEEYDEYYLSIFLPGQENCPRRDLYRNIYGEQECTHSTSFRDDEGIVPYNLSLSIFG